MQLREKIARIIDPDCWNYGDLPAVSMENALTARRISAYSKADKIIETMNDKN